MKSFQRTKVKVTFIYSTVIRITYICNNCTKSDLSVVPDILPRFTCETIMFLLFFCCFMFMLRLLFLLNLMRILTCAVALVNCDCGCKCVCYSLHVILVWLNLWLKVFKIVAVYVIVLWLALPYILVTMSLMLTRRAMLRLLMFFVYVTVPLFVKRMVITFPEYCSTQPDSRDHCFLSWIGIFWRSWRKNRSWSKSWWSWISTGVQQAGAEKVYQGIPCKGSMFLFTSPATWEAAVLTVNQIVFIWVPIFMF